MELPLQAQPATLNANGRIVIPAVFRKAMGWKTGQRLLIRIEDGEVHVYTIDAALARIWRENAKLPPHKGSVVDELIAERRAEARREAAEDRAWMRKQAARARRQRAASA